jgi:SAM-dependent methyltransferase
VNQKVLIFHLWNARIKARKVAEAEAFYLLRDLQPQILKGGPLSEKKGIFWIAIPEDGLTSAVRRFERLGYTRAVDLPSVVPEGALPGNYTELLSKGELIRWRNQYHQLVRLHETEQQTLLDDAPDRREFYLQRSDGLVRAVKGYRGDGQALSRRALPAYDARMLANLVRPPAGNGLFLDPFAGAGGIVLEAIRNGYQVYSIDSDPFLVHGLAHLGAQHCLADARRLPFGDAMLDAIATEPPYDPIAEQTIAAALQEMTRVLKVGACLAIFAAAWQAEILHATGRSLPLSLYLDSPVNRKGTDCIVLAWEKVR